MGIFEYTQCNRCDVFVADRDGNYLNRKICPKRRCYQAALAHIDELGRLLDNTYEARIKYEKWVKNNTRFNV